MNFDEARRKAQEKQTVGNSFGGNQGTTGNNAFGGAGSQDVLSGNAFDENQNAFGGTQGRSAGDFSGTQGVSTSDFGGTQDVPSDDYFGNNQSNSNNNAFDENQGVSSGNNFNENQGQGMPNGDAFGGTQEVQNKEPQVSNAILKARQKYEKKQLDNLEADYDTGLTPEQESKMTEYFGEVNKSFHQSDAILEAVVPFKADPQGQNYESQRVREGHCYLLRFKSINPYTNSWEPGFRLMVQTATITKESRGTNNLEYEIKPETIEKMNYLINLVFGKYGITKFDDLPKMNVLVNQNKEIKFKVYWREQTINQQAKVIYSLTNHSQANFIQTEKVDSTLAMLVNRYGKLSNDGIARLYPAKIVMLRDNINFRRFELALEVVFPNGQKHYYGKTFNYNQQTDNQGRKIVDFHEFSKFPPDMVQKQNQIVKLKNITRIDYKDFNIISQRNFIPVNFTVRTSNLKRNGQNVLYIDIV